MRVTKDNLKDFVEAFNTAVKDLVYSGGETIMAEITSRGGLELSILPREELRGTAGNSTIFVPVDFKVNFFAEDHVIDEIPSVLNVDDDQFIQLVWKEDNKETYFEVSRFYVDFGSYEVEGKSRPAHFHLELCHI